MHRIEIAAKQGRCRYPSYGGRAAPAPCHHNLAFLEKPGFLPVTGQEGQVRNLAFLEFFRFSWGSGWKGAKRAKFSEPVTTWPSWRIGPHPASEIGN